MKRLLAALAVLVTVSSTAAEKAALKGAVPGKWTQDYQAALTVAKRDRLPVLLKFTGSDWCGWCILMEKQVFSKPEFLQWADGRILLVTLDSPRDVSLVPEAYRARNNQLFAAYGIRGVPRYVFLDADGQTLGSLGASREATPASFSKDAEKIVGSLSTPKAQQQQATRPL